MEYEIAFSIVMAAYNSENTIGLALQSIREQDFDQKLIEILVIDGGSEDNTRNIALQYGAKVIDNPQKLPEPAKIIGLKAAQGKYVQIMDSDEVISNDHILSMRYSVLEKYDSLKVLTGGYQNPVYTDMMQTGMSDMGACSEYINKVGDPFTCFVYGTYKGGSMPGLTIRRGMYDADLKCWIAHFSPNDIRPIGDSVTTFDRKYITDNYSDILDNVTTAYLFDRVVADTGYNACICGDDNFHYSRSTFKIYFSKLRFRVINNIFNVSGSGYSASAQANKKLRSRKYLFPFYTLSVVLPCIDGIRMSVTYKHPIFLFHVIFSWYVCIEIVWQYMKKAHQRKSENLMYGE